MEKSKVISMKIGDKIIQLQTDLTIEIPKQDEEFLVMGFEESLEYLGISQYRDDIFNSNSHGELFHCHLFMQIANSHKIGESIFDLEEFSEKYTNLVNHAKEHMKRPISIHQHSLKIIFNLD